MSAQVTSGQGEGQELQARMGRVDDRACATEPEATTPLGATRGRPEPRLPASKFGDGLEGRARTPNSVAAILPATVGPKFGLLVAGSPRTPKIRTFGLPLSVAFYVAGPTGMGGRLRRRDLRHAFSPGDLPSEGGERQRQPEPEHDRAAVFQAMLDSGKAQNRAELARLLGCSRAWVTKVLGSAAANTP